MVMGHRWRFHQQCLLGGGQGYSVPPSTPTSPTHCTHNQQPRLSNSHLSPSSYMIPYRFGVDTDDADGIFLSPRRRRRKMQHRDDDDDCMEMCWDGDRTVNGGGDNNGDRDDDSLASSSIPSIRMAVHLESSTTTAEDQDDSILQDTNDDGSVLLEPDDGLSFVPYLDEAAHQHHSLGGVQEIHHSGPSDMAVTPSPPRSGSRRFFDDESLSWDRSPTVTDGGERSEQQPTTRSQQQTT